MPRQRRVVIPGIAHHVRQRGNNRRHVFLTDEDRELYLSLLKKYAAQYSVGVIGYCLMTNQIHLIVVPETRLLWRRRSGARTATTRAGFTFAAASRGIYGRIGSSRAGWNSCISGQR
jgi:REP element-mobilizing transposase RayT